MPPNLIMKIDDMIIIDDMMIIIMIIMKIDGSFANDDM